MPQGTIKKIVRDRGFGFITPADRGGDLFFHISAVDADQFDNLEEGQKVEFEIDAGADRGTGPRAVGIRTIS
jgi:CspA family cold shock protein